MTLMCKLTLFAVNGTFCTSCMSACTATLQGLVPKSLGCIRILLDFKLMSIDVRQCSNVLTDDMTVVLAVHCYTFVKTC